MTKLKQVKEKAELLGLEGKIKISKKKNKKYDYVNKNNKIISFGDKRYEDFLDHKDLERRKNYRIRHNKIYTKDGKKAINIYESPAHLSYNLLW